MIGELYCRQHGVQTESEVDQMWYAPAPVSLADVPWLTRDKGEKGIHLKAQTCLLMNRVRRRPRPILNHSDLSPWSASTPNSECHPVESGYNTPTSSSSSEVSTAANSPSRSRTFADNPEALEKISAMEKELLALRQQVAVLVLAQEQTAQHIRGKCYWPALLVLFN